MPAATRQLSDACRPNASVRPTALPWMTAGPTLVFMSVASLHYSESPSSLRGLVTTPQRGLVEVATLASLYGVYELVRGQAPATLAAARAHTDTIVSLERSLHFYGEQAFQRAIHALPGLPTLLGLAYILLHFVGTAAALVWIHRRHRGAFPLVRNTLIVSTSIALVIYVLFPVAPPRLAGLGFVDTVTDGAHVNLSSDMLGSLYNPFAAVPSLHFGYALLVGVAVAALAGRRWARALGWAYPAIMLLTIVSTGNHFFFDAAAGGLVIAAGYLAARRVNDAAPAAHWRGRQGAAVAPC